MSPSDHLKDILVAPVQMTVGSLDDFRLEVIGAATSATVETTPHLSVDLRGTQIIDATGLGVLLLLHKRAREKGLKVRLLGPSPTVLEVLRNTRVHLLFDIIAPAEVGQLFRGTSAAPATAPPPAPPSLDEIDPHPSVNYPGLSSPFEAASAEARVSEPEPTDEPAAESEPIVEPDAEAPPLALAEQAAPPVSDERRCPDCGRVLPGDREVQFCPWCGTGDQPSAAPEAASASVRPPRTPRLPTSRTVVPAVVVPPVVVPSAVTPSAVPPSHPATLPRRDLMSQPSDDFRALLDATQLYHRIDEDGDARIIFPLESGRTQTAWITRNVDAIGEYAFRYVMSFVADAGEIAGNFGLMASLLEQVSAKKGGGLVTRGTMMLYRIPVSTQASPESLAGAVALAAGIADELESAITGEA
ncbi:MAG: hypothetical protein RL625_1511 [Gemmatimonadota bacterium]